MVFIKKLFSMIHKNNPYKVTSTDESTYFLSAKILHPYPISMQNPMEGAYNTLSAITNPTGKKRFDAGKKGSIIIAKLCRHYIGNILEILVVLIIGSLYKILNRTHAHFISQTHMIIQLFKFSTKL